MKIDKKYIVLLSIVGILILILLLNNYLQNIKPPLPKIKQIKFIDKVEVYRKNKLDMIFILSNSKWWFLPDEYPAEDSNLDLILDNIKKINLVDLISRSGIYENYNLDDENKIVVKAYSSNNLIREIIIGKPSPTYQHTYIMLGGDKNVYTAKGRFTEVFSKDKEAYCSKNLVRLQKDSIIQIIIKQDNKEVKIAKNTKAITITNTNQTQTTTNIVEWFVNNKIITNDVIDKFIDSITPLNASELYNEKLSNQNKFLRKINIKALNEELDLYIVKKLTNSNYVIGISGIPSLYVVPAMAGDNLMKEIK